MKKPMGIIDPLKKEIEQKTIAYKKGTPQNLLIIFTRNPELGKCKTRLARTIGDENALTIYKFLLEHTVTITQNVGAQKQVWYSEEIWENDIWDNTVFDKKLQEGTDLGQRMTHAFAKGFTAGFEKICIIGSDMYDLDEGDIKTAFNALNENDFVIGPALDGGYYLLGMKHINPTIFENKDWGTDTVLSATLADLENEKVHLLEARNDVDIYEDIATNEAFAPFLNNKKNDAETTR